MLPLCEIVSSFVFSRYLYIIFRIYLDIVYIQKYIIKFIYACRKAKMIYNLKLKRGIERNTNQTKLRWKTGGRRRSIDSYPGQAVRFWHYSWPFSAMPACLQLYPKKKRRFSALLGLTCSGCCCPAADFEQPATGVKPLPTEAACADSSSSGQDGAARGGGSVTTKKAARPRKASRAASPGGAGSSSWRSTACDGHSCELHVPAGLQAA